MTDDSRAEADRRALAAERDRLADAVRELAAACGDALLERDAARAALARLLEYDLTPCARRACIRRAERAIGRQISASADETAHGVRAQNAGVTADSGHDTAREGCGAVAAAEREVLRMAVAAADYLAAPPKGLVDAVDALRAARARQAESA